MASQIIDVSIACPTICSCVDQRKQLRVTSFCEGNPPVTGGFLSHRASNAEIFPFDDVIMREWNTL